jgi:molecular chaperone DnaK (HSP70)
MSYTMPKILKSLKSLFGKEKIRMDIDPKTCAAQGASIFALETHSGEQRLAT